MGILIYFIGYVLAVIEIARVFMLRMEKWGEEYKILVASFFGGILLISLFSWPAYFIALIIRMKMEKKHGTGKLVKRKQN